MKWENGNGMEIKKVDKKELHTSIEITTNMGDKKRYYTVKIEKGEPYIIYRIDFKDGGKRMYRCTNNYFKGENEKKFIHTLVSLIKKREEN